MPANFPISGCGTTVTDRMCVCASDPATAAAAVINVLHVSCVCVWVFRCSGLCASCFLSSVGGGISHKYNDEKCNFILTPSDCVRMHHPREGERIQNTASHTVKRGVVSGATKVYCSLFGAGLLHTNERTHTRRKGNWDALSRRDFAKHSSVFDVFVECEEKEWKKREM